MHGLSDNARNNMTNTEIARYDFLTSQLVFLTELAIVLIICVAFGIIDVV